jgi:hypothetical protein
MTENVYELILSQQKQIRELNLHLEALKRMFFEHRPPFVQAFQHQLAAVQESDFLADVDEEVQRLQRLVRDEAGQS